MKKSNSNAIFDTIATVIAQKPSGTNAYTLTFECPEIAEAAQPIQFVNIAPVPLTAEGSPGPALDMLLRRPLGFSQVRPEQGRFDVIYQVVGRGTQAMADFKPGDRVRILGPLGMPLTADMIKAQTVILVGGGLGLPPLYDLAPELIKAGKEVIVIAGARAENLLIMDTQQCKLKRPLPDIGETTGFKPFVELGADCVITLDTPAEGFLSGLVTEPLNKYLEQDFDGGLEIIACGPPIMMKVIAQIARDRGVKCRLIMEARMGCGLGACQACVCKTTDGYKRVCTEGPVFDAEDIVWE